MGKSIFVTGTDTDVGKNSNCCLFSICFNEGRKKGNRLQANPMW